MVYNPISDYMIQTAVDPLDCLPIDQRVVLAPVVLDLEHADARDVPLEVELDERRGRGGLGDHHAFVAARLAVSCRIVAVGAGTGGGGNVGGAGVGLLDAVGVVGDVGQLDD